MFGIYYLRFVIYLLLFGSDSFGLGIRLERMLTVEEITTKDSFKDICTLWEGLLKETESHSIFLSHDWFWSCLTGFSKGKEISTLIIRHGKSVIGIAPLWRYQDTVRGIEVRKYEFITSPDTPFVDFIIQEERRKDVLEEILRYLYTARKGSWDLLNLCQWPIESSNYRTLHDILKAQRKYFFTSSSSKVPYIPIKGEWEIFLKTKSAKFRGTRNNVVNRISKLKEVDIRCYRQDSNGNVFDEIIAVSKKGWKHNEGISITSQEGAYGFFSTLTNLAAQRGWLMVWLLKIEGVPVAMEYDLEYEGKVYALRADFDESFKKYSPGTYLEYQIIKHLFEKGYREYNTGPGLGAYKLHWTDQLRENMVLHICNNNHKGLAIWALESKILPSLKWFRNWFVQIRCKRI